MAFKWAVPIIVCLCISRYSLAASTKETISERMGRIDSSTDLNDLKAPYRFIVKRENVSVKATVATSTTETPVITTRWSLWPPFTTHSSTWAFGNASSTKNTSSNATDTAASYRHNKNTLRPSKGLSYYLWDTVYILFKCFRDNWKTGVVDCVTTRAASLMDGFFGFGEDWSREDRDDNDLVPYYSEDLEESPRQDGEGFERDEEEYDEGYDGGDTELSEGHHHHHHKPSKGMLKKEIKLLKKVLLMKFTTLFPALVALKLLFFITMSLGISFLAMMVGKAAMISVLGFVMAIVAALRRDTERIATRAEAIIVNPNKWKRTATVPRHPFAGGRREDRGHHHKKEKLKLKMKRFHKILHTVISTGLMALPVVIALKLKFFMLLSMGIAALSLVSGKAFILSMVSFVLAIVAILKKSAGKGHHISRVDDIHSYLPSRKSTFIDDYMPDPSSHYYYMRR